MKVLNTDVLVVGGGAAALRSAQYAARSGADVIIATRRPLDKGGTTNADVAEMAGFNSAMPGNDKEIELHFNDMIEAGQGVAEPKLAQIIAERAPDTLLELIEMGVDFEYRNGELYTFQSCFSNYPRTHVIKGHGHQISAVIRKELSSYINLTVLTDIVIFSLIISKGECFGAYGVKNGDVVRIDAKSTILATGGAGAAFEKRFCPGDVSGAGYEMAYEAGAMLENLEFMQIGVGFSHPVVNIFNAYIWEALPHLTDINGGDIFSSILPSGLSYRDVADAHRRHYPFSSCDDSKYLELAISNALKEGRGTKNRGINADLRHLTDQYISTRSDECGLHHMWPIARDFMRGKGVDLLSQPVEVAVFQHAMNGGIRIDEKSQSTIPGLFAVGECAGGPHGADRLGGNMFITCMVYGKIAGIEAARRAKTISLVPEPDSDSKRRMEERLVLMMKRIETGPIISKLNLICQDNLLVSRTEKGLKASLRFFKETKNALCDCYAGSTLSTENYDLLSLLTSMELLASKAMERRESRGSHMRMDYPSKDPDFERILEIVK